MWRILKEDPHGIVHEVQPVRSYFLGCDTDAPLSQEMIFDFRGADLFYPIKKISWDSTSLSALISCQKGCRCDLDMKKPPMGST